MGRRVGTGFSTSLDGSIAGPNDGVERPLGDGGERLLAWYFGGDTEYEMPSGGITLKVSSRSAELLRETHERSGALVVGRRHRDLANGWGGRHPMDLPAFVVTHSVPGEWVYEGSPLTFLTDCSENAVGRADGRGPRRGVARTTARGPTPPPLPTATSASCSNMPSRWTLMCRLPEGGAGWGGCGRRFIRGARGAFTRTSPIRTRKTGPAPATGPTSTAWCASGRNTTRTASSTLGGRSRAAFREAARGATFDGADLDPNIPLMGKGSGATMTYNYAEDLNASKEGWA